MQHCTQATTTFQQQRNFIWVYLVANVYVIIHMLNLNSCIWWN